jgi:PAS domain S-box-containing protein
MGLVSLAAFLLLVADLIFGLLPDEADIAKHVRKRTSEALAVQLTALVQTEQWDALRRTMHAVISRDPEVLSIGVRRSNGEVVAETGNHATHWVPPANNKSTLTSVLVPIDSGKEIWGRLEVAYRPTTPQTLLGWLKHPGVALTLLLLTVGFGVFYLYLKRILQRLDPNAAIPDRVRTAFDALSEGVLVIDKQGHILLANSGFRKLHPLAGGELTGKRIKDLAWLVEAVGAGIPPWSRAMLERTNVSGETIQIAQEEGEPSKVVINVTPIVDDRETVRGCLITFDDLSTVEHMNQALLDSVAQLEVAKQKIELQNVELKRLADHDQLTGSLTCRAFLEQAQQAFLKSAV